MMMMMMMKMMRRVAFGNDDDDHHHHHAHPGVTHRVCDMFDEWLLGDARVQALLRRYIARSVREWSLVLHGREWCVRAHGRQWLVGDGAAAAAVAEVCAKMVVASVVPQVVQHAAQLVSCGGEQRVKLLLRHRLVRLLDGAVVHAKWLLYENMFAPNA